MVSLPLVSFSMQIGSQMLSLPQWEFPLLLSLRTTPKRAVHPADLSTNCAHIFSPLTGGQEFPVGQQCGYKEKQGGIRKRCPGGGSYMLMPFTCAIWISLSPITFRSFPFNNIYCVHLCDLVTQFVMGSFLHHVQLLHHHRDNGPP